MAYRYYSTLRPIAPGTFPGGKKVVEIHNFDKRTAIESIDRMAWGYIDFENPLTDKEAKSYDLVAEKSENQCCGSCLYFNGEIGDGVQFCDDKETDVQEGGYCFRYQKK